MIELVQAPAAVRTAFAEIEAVAGVDARAHERSVGGARPQLRFAKGDRVSARVGKDTWELRGKSVEKAPGNEIACFRPVLHRYKARPSKRRVPGVGRPRGVEGLGTGGFGGGGRNLGPWGDDAGEYEGLDGLITSMSGVLRIRRRAPRVHGRLDRRRRRTRVGARRRRVFVKRWESRRAHESRETDRADARVDRRSSAIALARSSRRGPKGGRGSVPGVCQTTILASVVPVRTKFAPAE